MDDSLWLTGRSRRQHDEAHGVAIDVRALDAGRSIATYELPKVDFEGRRVLAGRARPSHRPREPLGMSERPMRALGPASQQASG
jgi:hypothetical protein